MLVKFGEKRHQDQVGRGSGRLRHRRSGRLDRAAKGRPGEPTKFPRAISRTPNRKSSALRTPEAMIMQARRSFQNFPSVSPRPIPCSLLPSFSEGGWKPTEDYDGLNAALVLSAKSGYPVLALAYKKNSRKTNEKEMKDAQRQCSQWLTPDPLQTAPRDRQGPRNGLRKCGGRAARCAPRSAKLILVLFVVPRSAPRAEFGFRIWKRKLLPRPAGPSWLRRPPQTVAEEKRVRP